MRGPSHRHLCRFKSLARQYQSMFPALEVDVEGQLKRLKVELGRPAARGSDGRPDVPPALTEHPSRALGTTRPLCEPRWPWSARRSPREAGLTRQARPSLPLWRGRPGLSAAEGRCPCSQLRGRVWGTGQRLHKALPEVSKAGIPLFKSSSRAVNEGRDGPVTPDYGPSC